MKVTKKRKKYIDGLWKNILIGEYEIANANYEIGNNDKRRHEIIEELFEPEKPWITVQDGEIEFGKEFAKVFKDYNEWEEYIVMLAKESPEMQNTVDVSGVTDGFLFIAGEKMKKRLNKH